MEKKKLVGEVLLDKKYITKEQLNKAVEVQKKEGRKLGEVLINLGFVNQDKFAEALAEQLGLKKLNLKRIEPDNAAVELMGEEFARKYSIAPVEVKDDIFIIAMADPLNVYAIDEISTNVGLNVESVVSNKDEIDKFLDRCYGENKSVKDILEDINIDGSEEISNLEEEEDEDLAFVQEMAEKAPIIKLVNSIILGAIGDRASDIHIEPEHKRVRLRYRIDGVLIEKGVLPEGTKLAVISRIKIMAGLDIAERRIPQDGRISVKIKGRNVDLRCSVLPTIYGEKIVLRVMDPNAVISELSELGMLPETLKKFVDFIESPHGMILVTGPTGCGKSSTLYAALRRINTAEDNIVTIEDPVESPIKGLNQVQINPKAGLTFASGLRSFMRQDPDIMMVGEIRDLETAEIAINAALTGHLVFSTLHANDASSVVVRLTNMGVEPFLVSSSVIGAVAQRLVRKICEECKEEIKPNEAMIKKFENLVNQHEEEAKFYHGKGCVECGGTGYKGRTGVFELFVLNMPVREAIITNKSSEQIRRIALDTGALDELIKDGFQKALKGITTLDEVLRVAQEAQK